MTAAPHPNGVGEPALEITRTFEAPRELVFAAWIDLAQLTEWSGPEGFTVTHFEGEAVPGGAYRMCMRSDEHGDIWSHGVWRELLPPERLVFTTAWETTDGSPEHEMLITVTLTDRGDRTEMHFRQAVFTSAESRDSHNDGWTECFDKLDALLARVAP
jgi:uncharacterized protein YndB with AHSA1/START domain